MKNRKQFKLLIIFTALFGLQACAQQNTLYEWNKYSYDLRDYYKNPYELEQFSNKLYESILKAEEKNMVPPGLYAEYGYVRYKVEDYATAVVFFNKEKALWPESAYFMNSVISRIKVSSQENKGDQDETS